MAKHKPKTSPYAGEAQALTLTRYGPEISALKALMLQAQENRDTALQQAKSGRQYTVGAVDQARGMVNQAYAGARQQITPAFANGGGIEAAALNARMLEGQSQAQTQLTARRVGAVEGEQAARVQAQRDFRSDQGKVATRASDLAQESGAFTASTISDLIGADRAATLAAQKQAMTLQQQERNSQRSAGIDPDTGKPIPGGRLDPKAKPGKSPWATTEAHANASDEIGRLISEASEFKQAGDTRADVADLLINGAEGGRTPVYRTVPIKDRNTGKVIGQKQERVLWKAGDKDPAGQPIAPNLVGTPKYVKTSKVEAAKSKLLLVAALDMAYDGHLSRKTQALLHKRGLRIDQLGDLTTFGEWLKTPAGEEWRRKQRGGGPALARPQYPGTRTTRPGIAPSRDQQPG